MFQTTIALLVFLFPLAYSPGPGNLFFAANGARFGTWATLPANTGYHLATWLVTATIGLGFVTALDQAPSFFRALQVVGALYVLWLAWKLMRASGIQHKAEARPASFVNGAVLFLLNPKAYVIIALMFTQFLEPTDSRAFGLVLLITTVFTLNNCVAFTAWTIAGDALGRLFRRPESARRLNLAFGLLLAAVAAWMLFA